jgi:hypothetical protein
VSQLIVLMHAPVVGPASWQPVAAELARAGRSVVLPSLGGFCSDGPPYAPRLVAQAARQIPAGPRDSAVLVTHSGAGVFAAQLTAAIETAEVTAIFADAALPGPSGAGPVVDAGFLPYLREISRDGLVPPWHQWWPGEDLSPLFGDEATRRAVTSEAAPLPLAFYEEILPPVPGSWPPGRAGYLLFSAAYRQQAKEAGRQGWPVSKLPGEHLHMLVRPAEVAAAIVALAGLPD